MKYLERMINLLYSLPNQLNELFTRKSQEIIKILANSYTSWRIMKIYLGKSTARKSPIKLLSEKYCHFLKQKGILISSVTE